MLTGSVIYSPNQDELNFRPKWKEVPPSSPTQVPPSSPTIKSLQSISSVSPTKSPPKSHLVAGVRLSAVQFIGRILVADVARLKVLRLLRVRDGDYVVCFEWAAISERREPAPTTGGASSSSLTRRCDRSVGHRRRPTTKATRRDRRLIQIIQI